MTAENLYSIHATLMAELINETMPDWHALTYDQKNSWEQHADEVNAKDKEAA